MKHKTSELTGALLDAAVAMAQGRLVVGDDEPDVKPSEIRRWRKNYGGHLARLLNEDGSFGGCYGRVDHRGSPSVDWEAGGPIIERERIDVTYSVHYGTDCWGAVCPMGDEHPLAAARRRGPTPLIAAMRAYVSSKFGDEVELPD